MLSICKQNNADNIFYLLASVCTVSRPSVFPHSALSSPYHHWIDWGCIKSWEGTESGRWTNQKDIPCHITACSAIKQRRRDWEVSPLLLRNWLGICLPGRGGECLILHYLFSFFLPPLLHLLNNFCLDPQVVLLLLFLPLPPSHWGWERCEQVAVWHLAAFPSVNPQQAYTQSVETGQKKKRSGTANKLTAVMRLHLEKRCVAPPQMQNSA